MKLTFKHAFAAILLVFTLAGPVVAGQYPDTWLAAFDAMKRNDHATALRLFRSMAEQGFPSAQFQLGFFYSMGWGVPQDYAEALKWFRSAADQGHISAQSNLGFMYRDGEGAQQDYVQAHMWFNLAAAGSGAPVFLYAAYRDGVAQKMTPAQIAEAQKRAREWKPTKQ